MLFLPNFEFWTYSSIESLPSKLNIVWIHPSSWNIIPPVIMSCHHTFPQKCRLLQRILNIHPLMKQCFFLFPIRTFICLWVLVDIVKLSLNLTFITHFMNYCPLNSTTLLPLILLIFVNPLTPLEKSPYKSYGGTKPPTLTPKCSNLPRFLNSFFYINMATLDNTKWLHCEVRFSWICNLIQCQILLVISIIQITH